MLKKRLLFKILLFIIAIFILYVGTISYLITDGFRDYEDYCSEFIPKLKKYHNKHHKYPQNLSELAKKDSFLYIRYTPTKCGYKTIDDEYSFYFSDGFMGVVGYNSYNEKWWYD